MLRIQAVLHWCRADQPTAWRIAAETDELAAAIDAAAPLYPGESRADVVRHLVDLGRGPSPPTTEAPPKAGAGARRPVSGDLPPVIWTTFESDWPA